MAVIKKENSYMGLPMNIARGNPVPLDKSEIWYSRAEMEAYAKESVVAYVGQIIQLVDETEKTATAYIIANESGDLIEVGSSTLGDNKSIELTEDGVLRLVGANSAQKGAQLVMGDNGVVSWVMPDTTTVEGLNTAVAALDERLDEAEEAIGDQDNRLSAVEKKLTGVGHIFNFAGSYTVDGIDNLRPEADDFDAGDVIIVNGVKEYVCIEYTETVTPEGSEEPVSVIKKRWELLGDPSGVTALEERVETIEDWKGTTNTDIATMKTDIGDAKTSIQNLVNKDVEINNALAQKASKEELNAVDGKTDTNAQAITDIQGDISTINTTLASKADQSDVNASLKDVRDSIATKADKTVVDGIVANYATREEVTQGLDTKVDTSTYNTGIAILADADTANATAISGVKATADKAKEDLAALTDVVSGKASTQSVTNLEGRVSTAESTISSHTSSINSLTGSITGLTNDKADKTAVEALDKEVKANAKAITDHAAEYSALAGRVTTAEGNITKAQGDATQALVDAAGANTAAAAAQSAADSAMAKAEEVLGTSGDAATANTVFGVKAAAAAAQSAADAAQGEVDVLEEIVSALDAAYKTADAGLNTRIEALEDVIDGVQGAMHFVGASTTDPTDEVTIGGVKYCGAVGDVVLYEQKEYVCTVAGTNAEGVVASGTWIELGDVTAEAKRIGELEDRMDSAEVETAKVAGIEKSISEINTAAAALAARVKDTEDVNAAQAEAITALQARAGAIEQSVTNTAATLRNELSAKAAELNNAISAQATAHAADIENLQSQINTINGQLTWQKMGQ